LGSSSAWMTQENPAVYRIRKFQAAGTRAPKYRCSFEVSDEPTGRVLASSHLTGRATLDGLTIADASGGTWLLRPTRKIMPARWVLSDNAGRTVLQLDAQLADKLLKPLARSSLAVLDANGVELYRLIDPRTGVAERVLGAGPGDWVFVSGSSPAARLVSLPARGEQPEGLLGKLSSIFAGSDRGVISEGPGHILPAHVALAVVAIHEELTESSS
jgi:hypothetical protein